MTKVRVPDSSNFEQVDSLLEAGLTEAEARKIVRDIQAIEREKREVKRKREKFMRSHDD